MDPPPHRGARAPVKRKRFSTRAYQGRLAEHQGKCARCRQSITALTGLDWDHVIPLELGGADELANLQPLCKTCHVLKTKTDQGTIAQAKRREARHLGTKAPPARPLAARPRPPKAPGKPLPPRRPLYE